MLQARSPGGQLHLLAGGFFVGVVAVSVFPGAVVVSFAVPVALGLGPVTRAVVEGGGVEAAPVAGGAAADDPVSVGMGMGTVAAD